MATHAQTCTTTIPAYAAGGLVTELAWLQDTEPMAADVMVAVEAALPTDYWDAAEDDDRSYTLILPADYATIVQTILARIGEEFDIDISAGVELAP